MTQSAKDASIVSSTLPHRIRKPLKLAILGTRGIPANYGGFETFAEELATRLVLRGHHVTVYCRKHYSESEMTAHRGVDLRSFPAIRTKYLDTVSHSFVSVCDAFLRPYQLILVCNAANAFLSWIPRIRGQRVVLNVDGIERRRQKWSVIGKAYYLFSERLATILPNEVVTDAREVQDYYRQKYRCDSRFIPYGATVEKRLSQEALSKLGIQAGKFLLYVSRLEPENNAHHVIQAYRRSSLGIPLVVVGDAPYSRTYISSLRKMAEGADVIMPGAIYGDAYRELLSHCCCYLHGCEVGGTHPALLEAMGTGSVVISHETPENREVLGETGMYCSFENLESLSDLMRQVCLDGTRFSGMGKAAQNRVRERYDWDRVTDLYEELFFELSH